MKKRIAFVVQRYGLEVNGGAELLARQMAEHMRERYEIEVITTKAVDYITWANVYDKDVEIINGVTVRRFAVERERNLEEFAESYNSLRQNPNHTRDEEEKWVDLQGPLSPALVAYLEQNIADYDIFVFVTYLYYSTVRGLPKVKDKAVLISTAHDEPPIYLQIFKELFHMPKAMFYLTTEEKQFVERTFENGYLINNGGMGGSGIELPGNISPQKFRNKSGISHYMVYAGRIDVEKGCKQLFDYFLKYKEDNDNDLKLVMMGKEVLEIPESGDIISLGFVSDQDKFDIIAGADFMIMPSFFESLSISTLEAMALSVPVVVNGTCDVLRGHCIRSNAGLYYTTYYEFEGCINYILKHPDVAAVMKRNGKQYVDENYTWDKITDAFAQVAEAVTAQ